MTRLRRWLLDLMYEENVQCDNGIESLVDDIENMFNDYITDSWSVDDCK